MDALLCGISVNKSWILYFSLPGSVSPWISEGLNSPISFSFLFLFLACYFSLVDYACLFVVAMEMGKKINVTWVLTPVLMSKCGF